MGAGFRVRGRRRESMNGNAWECDAGTGTGLSGGFDRGALWGHKLGPKQGDSITNVGYLATFAAMAALTVAVLLLVVAFFRPDYSFYYVAENHSTDVSSLAWLYKLSGLWAGREGSFLFWAWMLSLFASWVAYKRLEFTDALSNMGLMVTNVVLTLFAAGMMFSEPNNPFKMTPATLLDPATGQLIGEATAWGMNPLLQHWAMIIHPPTLFIGYAGLTIPFAFAIGALIVNDSSKKWVEIVDRITIFSWLFLGIGIGLGAIWAYVVLGWGGYWAWDPVENASLLPWLTGVGLLHSFTVYRRREGFKKWSIMLAAFSFSLVILGTFITRSGIVQSVHAFEADPVSLYLFLSMIIGSLAVAGVGLLIRWKDFEGNDEFESLTSKEAAYYFNNVIMLVAGILVAYLTITSALPAWLPFGGKSIPSTTFDSVARPVGILYLLILAVCPLLSWRGTDAATFWKRIKWPLVGAVVSSRCSSSTSCRRCARSTPRWSRLRPPEVSLEPRSRTPGLLGTTTAWLSSASSWRRCSSPRRPRSSSTGRASGPPPRVRASSRHWVRSS